MGLADQHCVSSRGGVPPLPRERIEQLLAQLGAGWMLNDASHLVRTYEFPDFASAMAFAVKVGEVAKRSSIIRPARRLGPL
jgi:hypothetical protein